MANRFKCLKTDDNKDNKDNKNISSDRSNRFQKKSPQVNSRWQRSKSPEKRNSFTKPQGNDRGYNNDKHGGGRRYDKGGFGKHRYNRGRRGPSVFDNVQKDANGRPMLAGATTGGFNIGLALQQKKTKKERNKKEIKKEKPKLIPFKKQKEEKKTEAELKAEAEWNKQMILNMQWETDSEAEEEEEEECNDE